MSDPIRVSDKTEAQVALRWLLQKDVVPSIVIGARTLEQLDQNMAAANGWALTVEQVCRWNNNNNNNNNETLVKREPRAQNQSSERCTTKQLIH